MATIKFIVDRTSGHPTKYTVCCDGLIHYHEADVACRHGNVLILLGPLPTRTYPERKIIATYLHYDYFIAPLNKEE